VVEKVVTTAQEKTLETAWSKSFEKEKGLWKKKIRTVYKVDKKFRPKDILNLKQIPKIIKTN
jgi:hypothetical protein